MAVRAGQFEAYPIYRRTVKGGDISILRVDSVPRPRYDYVQKVTRREWAISYLPNPIFRSRPT